MSRTIRKEIRKRGVVGWFFLLIFIGFNVLMAYAFFAGMANVASIPEPSSSAGRAGAAIGTTLGAGMILFIWAAGSVITGLLALLTRGQKTIIEEVTNG